MMTGYRIWRPITKSGLKGLFFPYVWHPGVNISTCNKELALRRQFKSHEAPDENCYCGFWMLPSLEEAISYYVNNDFDPTHVVIGQVRGWGRMIEHTVGIRTERAQVTRLLRSLNPNRVDLLARRFDVPTFTSDLNGTIHDQPTGQLEER
jgi:hypothetical protein